MPADTQGAIEVDFRYWRADQITTLSTQVPVQPDPAPSVVFDSGVPDTLSYQVGEALHLPFTLTDPGLNRLTVEYLIDGKLLTTEAPDFLIAPNGPAINGANCVEQVNMERYGEVDVTRVVHYPCTGNLGNQSWNLLPVP